MGAFTDKEIEYLRGQRLARLATVGPGARRMWSQSASGSTPNRAPARSAATGSMAAPWTVQ